MIRASFVFALLAGVAVACSTNDGSTSGGSNAPPATFSEVYAALFPTGTLAQCNYCHDRPANNVSNGKLNMGHTQVDAYKALLGVTSSSDKCGGKPLLVAGNPDASLFYVKLSGPPPCGDRMPQGGSSLTADQLQMVRSWISAGAQNN